MESPVQSATPRIHFRSFELDLHTRELFRNGNRVKLQGQPIDVLELLLERPGELVTREELRNKLWPEDTFVDFEHSLNSTIKRLRDALGDEADHPRYIETLPRLGYRFIAEIDRDSIPAGASESATPSPDSPLIREHTPPLHPGRVEAPLAARPRWNLHRWGWLLATGFVAATAMAVVWIQWFSTPRTLVVTNFEPVTHDGWTKLFLTTDGNSLYFIEEVNWGGVLKQVSVHGGETSTFSTPVGDPYLYDIAPDRSGLLLSAWGSTAPVPLWVLPLPQGAPRRLGDVVANSAAWTPDGKQVVFSKGTEIWTSDVDGSHMRKLWTAPGPVGLFLRVSPDGKRMRFPVCQQSRCALWEANADGSGAHKVLPDWERHTVQGEGSWSPEAGGSWSPDGRYYVFGRSNPSDKYYRYDLWLIPGDRRWFSRRSPTPVQLTRGPQAIYPPVVFSPDGQTIFAPGIQWGAELARYDPDTRLTAPYLSGIPATLLDFSRDGQWISYAMPDFTLWRCRRDGSERVQLTSPADSKVRESRWSPDGRSIAFEWTRAGKKGKIALISRDGGPPEQLIPDSEDGNVQGSPTWSSDGKQIVLVRGIELPGFEWKVDLAIVDLRTRKVRKIPGSEGLWSTPRWSPDGRYLAATTLDFHTIRLFDFDKQVWTNWFTAAQGTAPEFVDWLLWSRDSKALYFFTIDAAHHLQAWSVGLGSHTPTKIADVPDERFFFWQQGPTLEPDGGILYTRNLSKSEIYALHLSEK